MYDSQRIYRCMRAVTHQRIERKPFLSGACGCDFWHFSTLLTLTVLSAHPCLFPRRWSTAFYSLHTLAFFCIHSFFILFTGRILDFIHLWLLHNNVEENGRGGAGVKQGGQQKRHTPQKPDADTI